jgi:hypothetical protein
MTLNNFVVIFMNLSGIKTGIDTAIAISNQ